MPCYSPLQGYQTLNDGLVFNAKHPGITNLQEVGCGQCIGCRLEHSRQWAVRCVHETQMHPKNSFITLSYSDDNLPFAGSLHKPDWVNFMKRLRKKYVPKNPNPNQTIRFYQCGEYGEQTFRPHYHACMFNYRPTDGILFSENNDIKLYTSETLSKIWGLGHVTFGDVTFESAAYCARYTTSKITGDPAQKHYEYIDPETGEISDRLPEYCNPSRRPGIGLPWLKIYGSDTYSKDEVILRSKAMKPPRAYDKHFEHVNPELWLKTKSKRRKSAYKKHHPIRHTKGDGRDPTTHKTKQYLAGAKIAKSKLQQKEL